MNNRISNRDVMTSSLSELFWFNGKREKAECMYTDPPWGAGAMKLFRTMNKESPSVMDFEGLLVKLKNLAEEYVWGPVIIEMGQRFQADVIRVFGKPLATYYPKYSTGITQTVMCYHREPDRDLGQFHGPALVAEALKSVGRPRSVFDPFIGLGTTAKACRKLGLMCLGNELNRERMLRTTEIMTFEEV